MLKNIYAPRASKPGNFIVPHLAVRVGLRPEQLILFLRVAAPVSTAENYFKGIGCDLDIQLFHSKNRKINNYLFQNLRGFTKTITSENNR